MWRMRASRAASDLRTTPAPNGDGVGLATDRRVPHAGMRTMGSPWPRVISRFGMGVAMRPLPWAKFIPSQLRRPCVDVPLTSSTSQAHGFCMVMTSLTLVFAAAEQSPLPHDDVRHTAFPWQRRQFSSVDQRIRTLAFPLASGRPELRQSVGAATRAATSGLRHQCRRRRRQVAPVPLAEPHQRLTRACGLSEFPYKRKRLWLTASSCPSCEPDLVPESTLRCTVWAPRPDFSESQSGTSP